MSKLSNTSSRYHFPWREGNRFEVLVDGPIFIPRMLNTIDSAQNYILVEMYLVESGSIVDRFIDALQNVAERGVQTYLLFDDYGTMGLKQLDRNRLTHKNLHIVYYNRLHSHNMLYNLYRIFLRNKVRGLHRNHRKLILVDGETAYTGGMGLTDAFDPPKRGEKRWRETMIKIQGPVVTDWQQLFVETWLKSSQQPLALQSVKPTKSTDAQLGRVIINDIKRYSELVRSLTKQVIRAENRVWFATAYFVPSWRIRRKLKRAARSGVDVRLLLPGPDTDHPAVRYASHRFYGRLLKNGVRIYEYQTRFFHTKCVLCDDWVTIGSSNFDRWNLRWNLEANQEIKDKRLAKQVHDMFTEDFSNSVEYTYENWQQRSRRLRVLQWFWKQIERFSQRIGR